MAASWLREGIPHYRTIPLAPASAKEAARPPAAAISFDCKDCYENTSPVGIYKANAFGLDDTLGNVSEWVQDCFKDNYTGAHSDGSARTSGDCSRRVLRGGSWDFNPRILRSSVRFWLRTDFRSSGIGFRVARMLPR